MRISVCIPTRGRGEFLRSCLSICLEIDDPDVEFVISDNGQIDDTEQVAKSFNDPRVKYFATPGPISQRQNFNHVLEKATGDYLMIIGDDDSVLPGQWPLLRRLVEEEKPESFSWLPLSYQWPDGWKKYGGGRARLTRKGLWGDLRRRHRDEMLWPGDPPHYYGGEYCPMIYHALVSRRSLDKLAAITGEIFMGSQVDVYFAAASLAVIERHIGMTHPFTMMGFGPRSGGASVYSQHHNSGEGVTSRLVARENIADPLRDPIPQPYPVLGFYLLVGIEQARIHAFGGKLKWNMDAVFDQIFLQLAKVGPEARAQGVALLYQYLDATGQREAFGANVDARVERMKGLAARYGLFAEWRRGPRFNRLTAWRGFSRLDPLTIVIDMKRFGAGDVASATRVFDHLIGRTDSVPADAETRTRRWREALKRGAKLMVQSWFGRKPDWLAARKGT